MPEIKLIDPAFFYAFRCSISIFSPMIINTIPPAVSKLNLNPCLNLCPRLTPAYENTKVVMPIKETAISILSG